MTVRFFILLSDGTETIRDVTGNSFESCYQVAANEACFLGGEITSWDYDYTLQFHLRLSAFALNNRNTQKEATSMNNEYLNDLSQEFDLEEIERKLNSTSTDTVKANEFFLLAQFQMRCKNL